MKLSSFQTIRGIEVEVIAEDFDGDPSVGIPYGPEQVYANTLDGEPFELSQEEEEQFIVEFSKKYDELSSASDWD